MDENGIGYFPSATTVNRSRALLDNYGMEVVGCHQKDTKCGKGYYLNFENAFCLLKSMQAGPASSDYLCQDHPYCGWSCIKKKIEPTFQLVLKLQMNMGVNPITGSAFIF